MVGVEKLGSWSETAFYQRLSHIEKLGSWGETAFDQRLSCIEKEMVGIEKLDSWGKTALYQGLSQAETLPDPQMALPETNEYQEGLYAQAEAVLCGRYAGQK